MKVLFLDCDGVLNDTNDLSVRSGRFEHDDSGFIINTQKVRLLQDIVEQTDCRIVLSSAWRLWDEAIKTLEYYGIEIYDVTPSFSGPRGGEIQFWLNNSKVEIERYAIVDDDSDMLDHQWKFFFQTDHDYGLTKTIAYRITHYLNKGRKEIVDYGELWAKLDGSSI